MQLKEDVTTIFITLNTSEKISLAIMLYTCETQPLVLGEEYKLQVFEIKMDDIIYTEQR
jgi:hypothetical protein